MQITPKYETRITSSQWSNVILQKPFLQKGFSMVFFMLIKLWLIVSFPSFLFAQASNLHFNHLTIENGLADNSVNAGLLDQQGYIWFATLNGLSKYNGNTFQNFYEIPTDSTTLGSATVMDLVEDEDGILWIATLGDFGLNRFDPLTLSFRRILLPIEKPYHGQTAKSLLLDRDQEQFLWIGTYSSGLLRFDKTDGTFTRFELGNKNGQYDDVFRENSINHLAQDPDDKDRLWLAANNGIYHFHKKNHQMEYFPFVMDGITMTNATALWVLPQTSDVIWVGTWSMGLAKFEVKKKKWSYYYSNLKEKNNNNIYANIINQVEIKSDDELWICSQSEGVSIFNIPTEQFSLVKRDLTDPQSIQSNKVNGMYLDKEGRSWFFNEKNGISILDPSDQHFMLTELPKKKWCPNLETSPVTDFLWDEKKKQLYVFACGCDVLYILDQQGNVLNSVQLSKGDKEIRFHDYSLLLDSKGNLWIAGLLLYRYNPTTNTCDIQYENTLLVRAHITDIIESKSGHIWMTSKRKGLVRLTPESGEIKEYFKSDDFPNAPSASEAISNLMEDSKGNLWIASMREGVFKFDPKTASFTHFAKSNKGIQDENIMALAEDNDGMIWVGCSSNGIQLIDNQASEQQEMHSFSIADGLPTEQIVNMVKDRQGDMWISTRNGLSHFVRAEQTFVNYDRSNGFMDPYQDPFMFKKGLKAISNGTLLIGQENGFYTLDPKNILKNNVLAKVVLTGLKIFEAEQDLEKDINHLDEIVLKHDQNFFSIGLTALSFTHPEKNKIQYQLEGFNKNWITPLEKPFVANFSNVGAGTYHLLVKAANNHGLWSEEVSKIKIIVLPPWWKSNWAYLFYLLSFFGISYFLFRFQTKRLELRNQQMLERKEALRLKELDDFKTKFFTNVTHEFRTPLTVIMGLNENLKGNEMSQKLIRRNSKNLLRLVNQLLDISKAEFGNLKLNHSWGDIVIYLQYLTESFYSRATDNGIRLTFYAEEESLEMLFDEDKIQEIMYNLLSNAIKFTDEDGKIIVHVQKNIIEEQSFLKIKIKDTGRGIEAAALPHVFDRFYQADNSSTREGEGTGIGLALVKELVDLMKGKITVTSTEGKGTEFILNLPILKNKNNQASIFKVDKLKQQTTPNEIMDKEVVEIASPINHFDLPLLLIVEDNPDVAFYIQSILEKEYEIQIAKNGQIGIEKAIEIIPDIIISDVMMPIKDGYELCETLKQDERTSHIPIILLTAKATQSDRVDGLKFGADAYLVKPFDKEELLIRLENLIKIRQQLQQRFATQPISTLPEEEETMEAVFLKKVKTIIDENLADPDFNVVELSKMMQMSRSQVYRKVSALTGQTIVQILRTARLNKAKELLQNKDLNISEIAFDTGFKNPNYFARVFQQEFGTSPSDARK